MSAIQYVEAEKEGATIRDLREQLAHAQAQLSRLEIMYCCITEMRLGAYRISCSFSRATMNANLYTLTKHSLVVDKVENIIGEC